MAKTFNEFLQEFVNKPYEELVSIANAALEVIVDGFNKIGAESKPSDFILPFIATTLASDGKYTQLEHNFLNSVLEADLTYEEGKNYVQVYYNEEVLNLVDQMIDACGEDLKNSLIIFCLCFAAVDETVTREESAYLAKLLA